MGALFNEPRGQAVLWLFLGAVGLLAAVLGVARCLFAEPEAAPGRRAVAHWLPIVVVVVVASLLGQATLAVGIAFGASVAALSAVTGFLLVTHPLGVIPARARRVWTFLPVVALLTFILGFRGVLGWFEAAVLAGQGALAWMIWSARDRDDAEARAGAAAGDAAPPAARVVPARPLDGRTLGLVALALALAALAAWAACHGAERLQHAEFRQHAGLMATMVLGIVLAMPMAMTGAPAALEGRAWGPITAQVGVVMLNLCVLLPVAVAIPGLRTTLAPAGAADAPDAAASVRPPGSTAPSTSPSTVPADPPATAEAPAEPDDDDDADLVPAGPWEGIIYPRIAWRIDAVALLILSLLLVPAADGRLPLDRRVGVGLTVGYLLYLLSMMLMATGG